ncbi:reverse transcriptase domain-containing protein [Tanacetum coccineum]
MAIRITYLWRNDQAQRGVRGCQCCSRNHQRDNIELKHVLLTLVQNKQFFGHDKEDPHAHIRYFNKITSTLKFPNVPNTSVKLMLFSFSLEGAARIWLEKEPPRSIFFGDDLYSPDVTELKDIVKALLLDKQKSQAPATVKAVEESCVTYSGAHSYRNFPATDGNNYLDNIQEYVSQATAVNYSQGNTGYRSGSLPSNTVAYPKGNLKAITTRSGVSYDGPQIPPPISSLPKEMEQAPRWINKEKLREKDDLLALKFIEIFRKLHFELSFTYALLHMPKFALIVLSIQQRKILDLPRHGGMRIAWLLSSKSFPEKLGAPTRMILELADRSISIPTGIAEDVFMKVRTFFFPAEFVAVAYVSDPRVPLILGRPFLRTARALIDVHG